MLKKILIISLFSTSSFCMENRGSLDLPKYKHLRRPLIPANKNNTSIWLAGFECSICLDTVDQAKFVKVLKCHDRFHRNCINAWLNREVDEFVDKYTCPLCKQKIGPDNPANPINEDFKEIIADKNGILRLPKEILLEIIKFCIENTHDAQELKKIILKLGQINKLIRRIMSSEQFLLFASQSLAGIKNKFYGAENLNYRVIDFKLQKNLIPESINDLLKTVHDFSKYNEANLFEVEEYDKNVLLLLASASGNIDLTLIALSMGADIDFFAEHSKNLTFFINKFVDLITGWTPLMHAANKGHKGLVSLLIANGAKINMLSSGSYATSALHVAVSQGHKKIVEILLNAGADIEIKDFFDQTPLFCVYAHYKRPDLLKNQKDILQLLLTRGANVNATKISGNTVLMDLAARGGAKELAEVLIKAGAKLSEKNEYGKTALDIAKEGENGGMIKLLGGDTDCVIL